jgi:hypothetical protein
MLVGPALALLLCGPAVAAEAVLFQAQVQTDGVDVRAKPGTEPAVYVTQKLRRGDIVQVVEKTADGWLKIVPPPGSFSWINTATLRHAEGPQGVWLVAPEQGPVSVLVGSPYKSGKPDVVGTRLERGAQVVAIGDVHTSEDGDGSWLPIMPPAGEYRYIRATDVVEATASSAATTTTAAHPGGPAKEVPASAQDVHVGGPTAPANADPLLQQAEQLERAGDRQGAARLYEQLGNRCLNSNRDAATQYFTRAAWLRGDSTPATTPRPTNEAEALYYQARQYEQAGKWADAAKLYERLGDMFRDTDYKLCMQYYNKAGWLREKQRATPAAPTTGSSAPPQSSGVVQAQAMSVQQLGPGRLGYSTVWVDGRKTYVLQSQQGQVLAYLAPQAGVDLEHYVDQTIEVLGQVTPRSELRGTFMTVAKVRPMATQ